MKKKAIFYLLSTVLNTGMLYLVFHGMLHDDFPTFHQDALWHAFVITLIVHFSFEITGFMAPKPPMNDKPQGDRNV